MAVQFGVLATQEELLSYYISTCGMARGWKTFTGGAIAVESAVFGGGFRGFFAWNLALILLGIIVIAVFWFPW